MFVLQSDSKRFIAKDIWSTNFRNRQLSACIWPLHGRMQQFDNQTTSSMHLMHQHRVQSSDIINNFVNAFNCLKSDAVFLTLKQSSMHLMTSTSNAVLTIFWNNRQCIWWHRHQMQLWQFFQTIVSVHLILSRLNAAIQTSTASHLIAMKLSAACLTSYSIVDTIRCSIFDIKLTVCLFHSLIAASHLFDHFFTSSKIVDRFLYTFIWSSFLRKMHQSSTIRLNHFHIVNTCNLNEKSQK